MKKENVNPCTEAQVTPCQQEKTSKKVKLSGLFFGVDSSVPADNVLQNNLTQFDWVTRNKAYPNFWGRHIEGDTPLTKEEIRFIHRKGCKIVPIYRSDEPKQTEAQGKAESKKIALRAVELGIPKGTAVFVELADTEPAKQQYLFGLANGLLAAGYIPGFKANTDSLYGFDGEYSRAMTQHPQVFEQCLVWATAPKPEEYDGITTSHFIHPDKWIPFAPSCITRNDIALWQYGSNCHPIYDDAGKKTCFHIDLVKDMQIVVEKMF